jgi:hypothetical protein
MTQEKKNWGRSDLIAIGAILISGVQFIWGQFKEGQSDLNRRISSQDTDINGANQRLTKVETDVEWLKRHQFTYRNPK